MKLKRLLACFLVAATLCSLTVAVPASAAAKSSGFTDISDRATADAAEVLRLLGIVSGTGNNLFNPGKSLTRAEFCKMAVELLGKGDEAAAQANRNIFLDTGGSAWNWARGYINLAATTAPTGSTGGGGEEGGSSATATGDRLMMGKGNGNFGPGDIISYAESVTVLMRILGYTSKDVPTGGNWYDGYLATANSVGLNDGVTAEPKAAITRGQTALLFENLLYIAPKGGKDPYLTTLGGKITKEVILLDMDATTDDGTTGAVKVMDETAATYKTDHAPFDAALAGQKAKLVLDKDDKVVALQMNDKATSRTVTVVRAEATYITGSSGEKVEGLLPDTIAYMNGEKKTYGGIYLNLRSGAQVVLYYGVTGKLEYVFIPSTDVAAVSAVARTGSGNDFNVLTGGDTGYRVLKNGVSASMGDVRIYDVATYDKATKTLNISDLRLSGVYENVSPSPATPLRVTLMGATFPVLSSAYDDLASFDIGESITLLLTTDGQVAGAVPASAARSTTVGTVISVDSSSGYAKIKPLLDLKDADNKDVVLSGTSPYRDKESELLQGQLVTVSSSKVSEINISRLTTGGAAGGDLDLAKRTLGTSTLADNVRIYERVGNSAPVEISFSQITRGSVPAGRVAYSGLDYAGRINTLVLDDVTGDQYVYGFAKGKVVYDGDATNPGLEITHGNGAVFTAIGPTTVKDGDAIGVAASLNKVGSTPRMSGLVTLKALTNVPRAAFQIDSTSVTTGEGENKTVSPAPIGTVIINGVSYPVAGNVGCYNPSTKTWFASLDEARAYSDNLTVYYDRDPAQGGKIRLVVVQ